MYINEKIHGLPKPSRKGFRTGYKNKRHYPYIHFVKIAKSFYFKVHLKRQNKCRIKYFKTLKEAKLFVDFLRVNKYL